MTLGEAADIKNTVDMNVADDGCHEEHSKGSGRSSLSRNMAWTTTRESFSTAYEYHIDSESDQSRRETEEGKYHAAKEEGVRGRTLIRFPRHEDPFSRPTKQRDSSSITIRTTRFRERISRSSTFHEDPDSPLAMFDNNFLEPCPHASLCATVSEVLMPTTPDDPMEIDAIETVVSMAELQQSPRSKAQILPSEILEQIYHYLCASDFCAARHTCRDWFIKSMERGLLETMCRRSGIVRSVSTELSLHRSHFPSSVSMNEEWLMSKRLSRECALGGFWKGNGVDPLRQDSSPFFLSSTFDFVVPQVCRDFPLLTETLYTVSTCGQFLITANECLIYMYELKSGSTSNRIPSSPTLQPITSIICPARIIACSMDTSSKRYTLAVLLEGRMGMVCDITSLRSNRRQDFHKRSNRQHRTGASGLDKVIFNSSGDSEQPFAFPGIATTNHQSVMWQDDDQSSTHSTGFGSRQGSISRSSVLSQSRLDKSPTEQSAPEIAHASTMNIENGSRSFYQNICSSDDPPRSVAICPQRRCIAFGSSTGIELHWVDALTGQDLNRWFPLTSPSDFLFFLPPRKNVDSAKKLRLISSAARPCGSPAITSRVSGAETHASSFWQKLDRDLDPACRNGHMRSLDQMRDGDRYFSRGSRRGNFDNSNHFRAVPVSDGYHILFTDPASGSLCLGNDAPIGGPTKLLRKIWFEGPSDMTPLVYTSGPDLSWGVRVAVIYGNDEQQYLWFFSVPLDILSAEQDKSPCKTPAFKCKPNYHNDKNMEWQNWLDYSTRDAGPSSVGAAAVSTRQNRCWPIKIRGQEICKTSCVVDLSLDSGPEMVIWTFGSNGIATARRLNDGRQLHHQTSVVLVDGTIRATDAEGDFFMHSDDQETLSDSKIVSYDGTTSPDLFAGPQLGSSPPAHQANTILPSSSWSANHGRYSFQHLSWTILESGAVNQNTNWTFGDYRRVKTDFIVRLDVEIH